MDGSRLVSRLRATMLAWSVIALSASSSFATTPRIVYRSPVPGASLVRPETNLIWRFASPPDASVIGDIVVTGSASGLHAGRAVLAADGRTLLFQPATRFAWGETVDVRLGAEERFAFTIARAPAGAAGAIGLDAEIEEVRAQDPGLTSVVQDDSAALPAISSTIFRTPAKGRLFVSNFTLNGSATPFLMILYDNGEPFFSRAMTATCDDWKEQPSGLLTYFDNSGDKFYGLDSAYAVVDSFAAGNGYRTDAHDMKLLPDGHALLMSYDPEIVDMSGLVAGGDTAAIVTGLILQEIDEHKNVVFQWRSWDHFNILDATLVSFTATTIDCVHGNAIDLDFDGNLLLSSRHLDEITKIDRNNGDILWRFGGKNNQFTLQGDTVWFSHQHAIRWLGNGHYTLFDNGNGRTPPYSRACEYVLDQGNKTATLVWKYRNFPDSYGSAMGYVQRLDNGNTLICWGTGKPNLTEVTPEGEKVMELSLPPSQITYRGYRLPWKPDPETAALGTGHLVSLSEAEPNPFRDTAEILATASAPTAISAQAFDVSGRELHGVVTLAPEGQNAYRIHVDLAGRASGIYFCRVSGAEGSQVRRIVHLH
ncbi:MAG TPA: aryl-sulfate sulfotransferase [Candidatus Eisenbacteria bacterium]|nr:aryl-sulfate sulfotransferase [Candidatus Eisenbacteria bacterium]